jgi:DNA primase large subunit
MQFEPDIKHLARFPFLKKAQDFAKGRFTTLEALLRDPRKTLVMQAAAARISAALAGAKDHETPPATLPEDEILGYAVARIIVSCIGDRSLIDRLTRYESDRAYAFLVREDEDGGKLELDERGYSPACIYVAKNVGLDVTADRIPVIDYVELAAALREDRWRLVNRDVADGMVLLHREEAYELIRERIRVVMRRDLPYKVPQQVCSELTPLCGRIKAEYQAQALEQFGAVEEGLFPPCISALVSAISAGTNLSHMGRFALTAFLHNIGMNTAQIAEFFARAPDFDPGKTMYQVEHISGKGGTEYTAPACAAMRTNGICVNRDPLCEKVSHPLSYYRIRKKKGTSPQPARPSSQAQPSGTPGEKES